MRWSSRREGNIIMEQFSSSSWQGETQQNTQQSQQTYDKKTTTSSCVWLDDDDDFMPCIGPLLLLAWRTKLSRERAHEVYLRLGGMIISRNICRQFTSIPLNFSLKCLKDSRRCCAKHNGTLSKNPLTYRAGC